MGDVFSLAEFAMKLSVLDGALDVVGGDVIAKSCAMLCEDAKGLIGVPRAEWPPLKAATIARKDGVNSPLLDTGEMRDSITWNADRDEGYVGSNDKVLIYQEFGTSRGIPPRPVSASRLRAKRMKCTSSLSAKLPPPLRGLAGFSQSSAILRILPRKRAKMFTRWCSRRTMPMTVDEFMARALSAIELMALGHAHVPDSVADQSLARVGGNLRRKWRDLLPAAVLPDEGLAEVVEEVLAACRTKLQIPIRDNIF
jgi:hypothetical protein